MTWPLHAPDADGATDARGWFRPLTRAQLAVDIAIAAAVFVFGVLTALVFLGAPLLGTGLTAVGPLGILVAVILSAALALRRTSPALALAVAWVGALLQMALGLPPLPVDVAIFGVLYATAAYGTRVVSRLGLVSAFVGAVAVAGYLLGPPLLASAAGIGDVANVLFVAVPVALAMLFALGLSWTIGALVRTSARARRTREAQTRAEAETIAEQERTAIARDMHDVVAHSLAVVIAQADGARYAARDDPEAATEALSTISQTARAALADVRVLLTRLRHAQGTTPQPVAADLEAVYDHVRRAGVDVRVRVAPEPPGEPPAAVQQALYRIVQEALTNALRHGGPGAVDVHLSWLADRVALRVQSPLPERPPAPAPAGHGLIGMRERAAALGGWVRAGRVGGAFIVEGALPIGGPPLTEPAERPS